MRIPDGIEKSTKLIKPNESPVKPGTLEKPNASGKTPGEAQKPPKSAEGLSLPSTKAAFPGQKSQPSAQNIPTQNAPALGTPPDKPSGPLAATPLDGKPVLAGEFFKAAAAGMGLPKDALSVILLSFAHFFSMPLNQELAKTLRREILASGKSSSPKTGQEKAALEAEALAQVSAKDKGVVLSGEALERYARYLGTPDNGDRNRREAPSKDENPTAEEIKAITEEQAQNDGFLDLLNSLPGKNGHYWMVFPFNLSIKGIELDVIIRLLREGVLSSWGNRLLIADVKSPRKQWRCFLKETDGRFHADIRVYPKYRPNALKVLQKEAYRFLGECGGVTGNFKGFDEVLVRNWDVDSSWADDLNAESLLSINKEV